MHFRLSEPLKPLCGTLGFRGTQFEKHCLDNTDYCLQTAVINGPFVLFIYVSKRDVSRQNEIVHKMRSLCKYNVNNSQTHLRYLLLLPVYKYSNYNS
jgi:hypothetical protein